MTPLEIATPDDTTITVTRSFEAPLSAVWRAFTDPTIIPRWMTGPEGHTMPECTVDLRVGGSWRYVWQMPEGRMVGTGTFSLVEPERRLIHTETFDIFPHTETQVETEFFAEGGTTRVVMTMRYDSTLSRDAVLRTGMGDGMEAGYRKLDELLAA